MKTATERFWSKVAKSDDCWTWTATLRGGYGLFWIDGANRSAHRVSFEWSGRQIPDGLVLDHLCRNRACVNPDHLEVVDQRTNVLRGVAPTAVNASATHCKRGHEFTPENTYRRPNGVTNRQCIACLRISDAAKRKTDRGRAADRTHCPQGHEYSVENTYVSSRGGRQCRACAAAAARRRVRERRGD